MTLNEIPVGPSHPGRFMGGQTVSVWYFWMSNIVEQKNFYVNPLRLQTVATYY